MPVSFSFFIYMMECLIDEVVNPFPPSFIYYYCLGVCCGFLVCGYVWGLLFLIFCCNNNRWVPRDLFLINSFWFIFTFPALVRMVNQLFWSKFLWCFVCFLF